MSEYVKVDGAYAHVLLAEKALGKKLPSKAQVHHVDGIKSDNRPENLVVCPDGKYHHLLHARQKIFDAGGIPEIHKFCSMCFELKERLEFHKSKYCFDGLSQSCAACCSKYKKTKLYKNPYTPACREKRAARYAAGRG